MLKLRNLPKYAVAIVIPNRGAAIVTIVTAIVSTVTTNIVPEGNNLLMKPYSNEFYSAEIQKRSDIYIGAELWG